MKKILLLSYLFIFLIINHEDSLAAAWTQKQGKGQLISSNIFYNSSSYYNKDGNTENSSVYIKNEINPYFEYGWYDDITVGLSPSFQYVAQEIENGTLASQENFVSSDVFIRKRLYNENNLILSYQQLVKIPGFYDEAKRPGFGNRQYDIEGRLLLGRSFNWPKTKIDSFLDLEAAFRKRLENEVDEVRFDGTIGIKPFEKWMFMGQMFSTFGVESPRNRDVFDNAAGSFYLVKAQFSAVVEIKENKSLQFAVFKDVWGRSTGNGQGALISLWYSF